LGVSRLVEMVRIRKAARDCPNYPLSAEKCIKKALSVWCDQTYVSWSGGRCSTVVLFLALKIKPNIRVIFNDTGVEFPETYQFIEQISKEWNLNLRILKPKVNFFRDIIPVYGYPMLRGQYKDDSKSKDGKPMCCQLLKEEPLLRARIKCTITGIRVAESRMRMFAISRMGQYYKARTLKRWQYHPIAFWSTERLLKFIAKNNIPENKVYEMGQERCGCWPCTGYIGWRESIKKSHPRMYKFLKKQKGEPTLWEWMENYDCVQGMRV